MSDTKRIQIAPAAPTRPVRFEGAGLAANAYASAFGRLADEARAMYGDARRREVREGVRGAEEEAKRDFLDADGDVSAMDLRTGSGLIGEAYRNAVEGLALQKSIGDFEAAAVEYEAKDPLNPEGFEAWANGYVADAVKSTAPEIATDLELALSQRLVARRNSLAVDRQRNDVKEAGQAIEVGIANNRRERMALIDQYGDEAYKLPEYQRLVAEEEDALSALTSNPLFGVSDEKADALREEGTRADAFAVARKAARTDAEAAYAQGGLDAALATVGQWSADTSTGLSATERNDIARDMRQRVTLLSQIDSAAYQEEARREAQADRARVARGRAQTREVLAQHVRGELTRDGIAAMADEMEPEALRTAVSLLGSGGSAADGTRSELVEFDLTRRADRGEDVEEELYEALEAGLITSEDATTILGRAESAQDEGYRAGKVFIDAAFDKGPFDMGDPATATVQAEANAEMHSWRAANPEATLEESREQGRLIAKTYANVYLVDAKLPAVAGERPASLADVKRIEERLGQRLAEIDDDLSPEEQARARQRIAREIATLRKYEAALTAKEMP